MKIDPTQRFTDRVTAYVRYRPGYPPQVVRTLEREHGLTPDQVVADIGSGTGISSGLFLPLGCRVIGVEPNAAMRSAADRLLGSYRNFRSVAGSAEQTTLADDSVDFVVAGQAFHWFEPEAARREFVRILRPGGRVALLWNTRRVDATPFLRAYEDLLLRYGTDYREVNHANIDSQVMARFFGGPYDYRTFDNWESFDLEGLKGRLLSCSYIPGPADPLHAPMMDDLERIFARYRENGRIRFECDTELYLGEVRPVASEEGAVRGS